MYLKRLRNSRSQERVKPTLMQRIQNKRRCSFCQLFDEDDEFSQDQNAADDQVWNSKRPDGKLSFKELQGHFRRRQKSEGQLNFLGLLQFRDFRNNMQRDKMISNYELLEIRSIIQNLLKGVPKVGYYSVILKDTRLIIEFFIDQSLTDFLQIKLIKEIVSKFEQLRRDLNRKIQLACKND